MSVFKKLDYLFNYSGVAEEPQPKKGKKKKQNQQAGQLACREPRGTLLIVDRSFDLITPLIHDYQYQSTVFDYLPVPENGSLDAIIKP